jgi:hypothetical protein
MGIYSFGADNLTAVTGRHCGSYFSVIVRGQAETVKKQI